MRKLVIILCLSAISGILYAAGELQKIEGLKIGFSDPAFNAKPESTPLTKIGYNGALGFPYGDRELGAELPSVMTVNKLTLELELTRKVSQMSEFGIDKDIKLYVSNDNVKFHLAKSYKLDLDLFKRNGKDWVSIGINGISENIKYLKLCPRKGIKGYSGLIREGNLKQVFNIYRIAQLLKVENPRFMADKFKIAAELNINDYKNVPTVRVYLKIKNEWQLITEKVLAKNGKVSLEITDSLPIALAIGKYPVKIELIDKKGNVADSLTSSFYHTKKISDNTPGAGEIEILNPAQTGILNGKWIVKNTRTGFGETIKYVEAADSECSYSIELPDSGVYAVYVGLIGGKSTAKVKVQSKNSLETICLKTWRKKILNDDVAGEVFVGICSGGKIEISPVGNILKLSHVRLQGLTRAQLELVNSKAVIVPRLILHDDGFSGFYAGKMKNRNELIELAEKYKAQPLYSYDWCLGTSTAFNIKTRRGVLFGEGKTKFWRKGDKQASQIVNNLYESGINPLRVIAENLNRENIHINATLRLNATYPPQNAASHNGPFLMDNPQFRIVNYGGARLWQLSYAYPEVQDFMFSVLEDAVACGVDGIHLQFLRHPPFFGVDKPLIAEYTKRHGSFDLKKDYMNEKWQKLQCDAMTGFIERIRQMLDAKGMRNGKTLTLSVSFDFNNYYSQGLDVAKWVKSGWIDVISPGYYGIGGKTFDLKPFVRICKGTSCKIFPNLEMTLLGSDPTPDSETGKVEILRESVSPDYGRKLFLEFYNQGAYGMYPFNGGYYLTNAVANMKELKIWEEFEKPVIDWFAKINQ